MPKVLLTGVIGPHGNILFDIAGDRLMRDQDIFTVKSHSHFEALHFLAQNISAPCVVLERPTIEDLEEELENGYDFVGINFTLVNIPKTLQMCETIRRVAPDTKIVLGGYGTSCFTTIFKGNKEILKIADYICHFKGFLVVLPPLPDGAICMSCAMSPLEAQALTSFVVHTEPITLSYKS